MAKKKSTPSKIDNSAFSVLSGGPGFPGFGVDQVSKADTMFKSNRGYMISNMPYLLSEMYAEHGLIETVIDIPVEHALKGGFELSSKQISEEEIADLISSIEEEDMEEVKYAEKWKRLYGGSGLLTLTESNKDKAFKISDIKQGERLKFKAADIWELNTSKIRDDDLFSDDMQIKDRDRVPEEVYRYLYYGRTINSSRVLRLVGKRAPANIRARLRGWGLSEIESIVRSINQYLKTTDLSFEVLDEFKVDVYQFKGLANALMSPNGENLIAKRVSAANMAKNYNKGIALDKDDEYTQKQVSFVGISDVMKEIKSQLASDLRIPQTILFGQSAAGFNSGEDDIENFNSMIDARLRPSIKRTLMHVIKCRCMQKFGFVPTDLKLKLAPLRQMSAEQEEKVKDSKFNRLTQAETAGQIDRKEFREAANKDQLFSVALDVNKEMPQPEFEEDVDDNNEEK